MSKKRGLSADEKKQRMAELFYEKKDVFLLKELEKIAPKEKGIVAQSVKDVVQSLVDDNLVETDKIGTSVYFWSFPSQAYNNRAVKLKKFKEQVEESKQKLNSLNNQLKKVEIGKDESDKREKLMKQLETIKEERNQLESKLKMISGCDPETMKKMKVEVTQAKEAINRWTDNVFSIKSWCKNKFMLDEEVINKQFDIPEDLDYMS